MVALMAVMLQQSVVHVGFRTVARHHPATVTATGFKMSSPEPRDTDHSIFRPPSAFKLRCVAWYDGKCPTNARNPNGAWPALSPHTEN